MSNEIKMSQVRNFLNWYERCKAEIPFTKKGLWKIQKECWSSDLEYYWHYDDSFSSDQVEKILEGGLDAYNEICCEIEEYCYDSCHEMRDHFISEISICEDDLTDEFKKENQALHECEEDDIVDECRDDLNEFILEYFRDDLYVTFDFEDLLKRTSGEVYIDCEDFYQYDFFDIKELNPEKLLFATTDRELTDEERDLISEELSVTLLEDLDEVDEFSVCVASSLDEYLNMLAEAENKNTTEKPAELYFMARVGSRLYDVNRDALYLNAEPNFDASDTSAVHMDEGTYKKTASCSSYESIDDFKNKLVHHIYTYARDYFLANLRKLDKRDAYGRTLVHYALYVDMLGRIEQSIWEQNKQHLYYAEDDNHVSPLAVAIDVAYDQSAPSEAKENIDLFMEAAYSKLLNKLPRKNETSSLWETTSSMLGSIEGVDYYVIESNLREHMPDEDIGEYGLKSEVICLNAVDNTFSTLSLDSFTDLFPLENPVKVYLDGTVAA